MLSEADIEPLCERCPNGFRAFNAQGDVVHLSCDQWKCDFCRRILSWHWGERVRYGISLWPLDAYHWTLTLPGEIYSSDFAFKVLRSAWDNLRKTCQRQLPYFHYAAFVEIHPHRMGIAHCHIVTLHWSPGRLKDVAHHAGFGFQAEETTISGKGASYYVTKYTSKQGDEMPKGFRRVRLSRQWPKLPAPSYPVPILPIKPTEALADYFTRIAATSGITWADASARWEHKELDL